MLDLRSVLCVQTYSGQEWRMFAFIVRECTRLGAHITQDKMGNLYVIKGADSTYPCIVAHMDSVHPITSDLSVIEHGGVYTGFNLLTMQQKGIGGDDKVGIYIALRCLEKYDNIKLAFFVNEEQGCIGSAEADMTFFEDCRFVLQADRRGNKDFVTNASGTKLSSKKFKKTVKEYLGWHGYDFSDGMMTDVMQLKQNGLAVACANVSCGYYRPHSDDEYVVVHEVENCLGLFESIIENMTEVYEHRPERTDYKRAKWSDGLSAPLSDHGWSYKNGYWEKHKPKNDLDKYEQFWDRLDKADAAKAADKKNQHVWLCENCSCPLPADKIIWNRNYQAFLCKECNLTYA